MKVTSEKIDNHTTVLNMEIPQNEVAKALESAYKKMVSKVNIPGFRKGKAPRKIIEARFGKKALLDEAFEIIAPKAYENALTQEDIDPVSPPDVEVITLEEDQPLVFKATVICKPKVVLGEYKGLALEKPLNVVSDEAVENELGKIRERHAKMVVPEENAVLRTGDMAIIDYEGFIDGVPFEGGKGSGYPLQIGSGRFIPGFEEQLIGAKINEEREVLVSFPEDYPGKEVAGKEAKFIVKIQDMKYKELPALDDEFAKEISDFETFEEFKEDLRGKLVDAAQKRAEQEYLNALVQTATDNAVFEVPEVMVENQLNGIIESMDYNLRMRGMNLDAYLNYSNISLQDFKDKNKERALEEVRSELVLAAIAKEETLTVSPEDMEAELESLAQAYGTTADEVFKATAQTNRLSALENTILRRKAAQFLLDNAADKKKS